ncbi:MAG: tetratricopeptide repeat-containing protein kinase family protein, partial [Polyangiales bacterium]
EMLAITISAGRGLAAAHAAKLVHRDFKPENVLCADDGRVVVSDFGLARLDEEPAALPGTTAGTVTTLAGTPAYMGPELLAGSPATTASDQFSFCVATYEALYGERPFAGKTLDELRASIAAGVPRPVPAGSVVPARIRSALVRGLARDPAQRWESMDELLAALVAAGRPPRRRIAIIAGLAAALVGGAIAVGVMRANAAPSCDLEAVAAPYDRAAIQGALAGRGDLAARVSTALDGYWAAWTGARQEACEATHVRHELSDRVLDARNACLERARRELSELAQIVLREPARGDVAAEAIERVRDPASCTADSAGSPVPAEIDRATARLAAGEAEPAVTLANGVLAAMPDAHTRAEALFVRGRAEIALGNSEAAEATLTEALTAAERAHADDLVASIWVEIVSATGSQQHRFEAATANMHAAEAAFARIDPGPGVLSRYAYVVGAMQLAHGDAKAARAQLERALAAHGKARPGEAGMIHAALCDADRQLKHLASARADCQKAIAMISAAYGEHHARLGPTYNVWGAIELADNHVELAREKFTQATAIYEAAGLTGDRTYALALSNTAATWMRAGDVPRARPLFERARDVFAKYHPEHAQRVFPLQGLASAALETNDLPTAIRYYEEALEVIVKVYGAETSQRAIALYNLALAYQRLPDLAKADVHAAEVVRISQLPGKESWSMVASGLDLQAAIADSRKDNPASIALRTRALEALDHADDAPTRAWIEHALGLGYRRAKDLERAIEHYEKALVYF